MLQEEEVLVDLKGKPFYLKQDDIDWVKYALNEMSLIEKVGQLFCPLAPNTDHEELQKLIETYSPAGFTFRPGTINNIQSASAHSQRISKLPMIISANLEYGGNGAAVEGTEFASQMQVAATQDPSLAESMGAISAREGTSVGVNLTFSPVVDIDYNHHNPITNLRTYGSNPETVAAMGSAFVKGVQSSGMAATVKHFPGDGVDFRDHHVAMAANTLSPDQWDQSFGKVYADCINAGSIAVMIGHIALPEYSKKLRPELNDSDIKPATLAPELLNDLLREKLGFNGLIITDATTMVGFGSQVNRESSVPLSIESGCDLFLFNKNLAEDFDYMMKGIERGILSHERLNQAVTRILATKAALGLNSNDQSSNTGSDVVGCAEHKAVADLCADKAITLVKNREQLIPLSKTKYKNVLLIGLSDNEAQREQLLSKLQGEFKGYGINTFSYEKEYLSQRDVAQSVQEIKEQFDLVVYAACYKVASNKTSLRINWTLPSAIDAPWFSQEVPTLFISFGNPYHLVDVPRISTYINAYGNTDSTIKAVVEKLFGDSEFKGVSPVDAFAGMWDTRL